MKIQLIKQNNSIFKGESQQQSDNNYYFQIGQVYKKPYIKLIRTYEFNNILQQI
ncbi:hypothetical protein pb186bvf_016287 [Paramecium bursaria]